MVGYPSTSRPHGERPSESATCCSRRASSKGTNRRGSVWSAMGDLRLLGAIALCASSTQAAGRRSLLQQPAPGVVATSSDEAATLAAWNAYAAQANANDQAARCGVPQLLPRLVNNLPAAAPPVATPATGNTNMWPRRTPIIR